MVKPYPASLMVGFYARGDSTQPIRTDLDNELVGEYAISEHISII